MKENLQKALDNTEMIYSDLIVIANDIVDRYSLDITSLINTAIDNIENLTNDAIRELLLQLSLKAYSFSELKDKSALKAECAEMLRKEAYAKNFNSIDGSVAFKDNTAILATSNETLAESVYTLVAGLLKTKLDTIFRIVDTLKTVLTSRLSEAKLVNTVSVGE